MIYDLQEENAKLRNGIEENSKIILKLTEDIINMNKGKTDKKTTVISLIIGIGAVIASILDFFI